MDALTLGTFLIPILTVTIVWNNGETGDINPWSPTAPEFIKMRLKMKITSGKCNNMNKSDVKHYFHLQNYVILVFHSKVL